MEPPSFPPSDDGPSPDVRAFWIAFGLCVGPPVLLLALTAAVRGESSLTVLILGSLTILFADLCLLIYGITRVFSDEPGRWGTLLGVLVGALVGFGGCVALMGVV